MAEILLTYVDPFDVPVALRIVRRAVQKNRQNTGWVIGFNLLVLPMAGECSPACTSCLLQRLRPCQCRDPTSASRGCSPRSCFGGVLAGWSGGEPRTRSSQVDGGR